jgi:hypothetical protein
LREDGRVAAPLIAVARIGITPVKALALLEPGEVLLERHGVAENRRFYLVGEDGRLVNGRQAGALTRVRADCDRDGTRLALRLPDGTLIEDHVVLEEPLVTDFWGRAVAGHVCAGPWAAALSAQAGIPVRLVRAERAGDACDVHHVTLVSTASLRELAARSGNPALADPRRFRMLLVLEGCRPHEEDGWEGRRLRVGEAVIRVGGPVPRCVVTTLDPASGVRDADTLREIKAYRGLGARGNVEFGVYAEVEQPGRVHLGDPVDPADPPLQG